MIKSLFALHIVITLAASTAFAEVPDDSEFEIIQLRQSHNPIRTIHDCSIRVTVNRSTADQGARIVLIRDLTVDCGGQHNTLPKGHPYSLRTICRKAAGKHFVPVSAAYTESMGPFGRSGYEIQSLTCYELKK